jgi:hypothetical protein
MNIARSARFLESTLKVLPHWTAFMFSACLSIIALISTVVGYPSSNAWQPAFFSFLPMCFFFMANATSQTQREVNDLRRRLEKLEHGSTA